MTKASFWLMVIAVAAFVAVYIGFHPETLEMARFIVQMQLFFMGAQVPLQAPSIQPTTETWIAAWILLVLAAVVLCVVIIAIGTIISRMFSKKE